MHVSKYIYEENKEIQEGSPTNNIIVGNYRLRRAERWENVSRVSSEVSLYRGGAIKILHTIHHVQCVPGLLEGYMLYIPGPLKGYRLHRYRCGAMEFYTLFAIM